MKCENMKKNIYKINDIQCCYINAKIDSVTHPLQEQNNHYLKVFSESVNTYCVGGWGREWGYIFTYFYIHQNCLSDAITCD